MGMLRGCRSLSALIRAGEYKRLLLRSTRVDVGRSREEIPAWKSPREDHHDLMASHCHRQAACCKKRDRDECDLCFYGGYEDEGEEEPGDKGDDS